MLVLSVKALHLIFMVTWFSGLFYLPRLFVYHAMAQDFIGIQRFKIMERKLYYGITTPGGVITILTGGWLLWHHGWDQNKHTLWLHAKLGMVLGLVFYHLYCGRLVNIFKHDLNKRSHVFYRWINEIPVIFLFGIIFLVVLRPR